MDTLKAIREYAKGQPLIMCEMLKIRSQAKKLAMIGGNNLSAYNGFIESQWEKLADLHDSSSDVDFASDIIKQYVPNFNY